MKSQQRYYLITRINDFHRCFAVVVTTVNDDDDDDDDDDDNDNINMIGAFITFCKSSQCCKV